MANYAILTTWPPSQTGIAEFSAKLYKNNIGNFDIFTPETLSTESSNNIYSLSELWQKALMNKYKGIIFTIGNSHHNVPIVDLLRKFRGFPGVRTKLFIHLHDPVVTNVANIILRKESRDGVHSFYLHKIERFFHLKTETKQTSEPETCIYRLFEQFGATGLSSILHNIPISAIICHSNSAINLCERDFSISQLKQPPYIKLFHPCFEATSNHECIHKIYDLGVFGYLDNGGKMTDRVMLIVKKAYEAGLIKKVVFAGFNVHDYFKAIDPKEFLYIDKFNNPSDKQLSSIMSLTKVSLHPRAANTGESSGVIPMLLANNVVPIVSKIGAFSEYPENVCIKVNNNCFGEMAFLAIEKLLRPGTSELKNFRQNSINYISSISKHRYLSELDLELEKLFESTTI